MLDFFSISTHCFMNVIKTHLEVILLKSQTVRFATTKIRLKLLDWGEITNPDFMDTFLGLLHKEEETDLPRSNSQSNYLQKSKYSLHYWLQGKLKVLLGDGLPRISMRIRGHRFNILSIRVTTVFASAA